jgi:hypothetical protein
VARNTIFQKGDTLNPGKRDTLKDRISRRYKFYFLFRRDRSEMKNRYWSRMKSGDRFGMKFGYGSDLKFINVPDFLLLIQRREAKLCSLIK